MKRSRIAGLLTLPATLDTSISDCFSRMREACP
jgi:hypothetical protein